MAEGRGSALVVAVIVIVGMLAASQVAEAATYTVGAGGGWTYNVAGWPKGKTFRAGDTLVFNYNSAFHNVVAVDRSGYQGCAATPATAKVFQTGKDQIKLKKGQNFFICSIPGHCTSGMKIAVTAS